MFLLEVCGFFVKLVVGMYVGSILVVGVIYIYMFVEGWFVVVLCRCFIRF
jgi:hypothetical protein